MALQGNVALSCWLQWTEVEESDRRKSAPCSVWKDDSRIVTRRGRGSQQAGRRAGAHQHQVPEMTKSSLEIQKGFSTDFGAAQEATASSWSRS